MRYDHDHMKHLAMLLGLHPQHSNLILGLKACDFIIPVDDTREMATIVFCRSTNVPTLRVTVYHDGTFTALVSEEQRRHVPIMMEQMEAYTRARKFIGEHQLKPHEERS